MRRIIGALVAGAMLVAVPAAAAQQPDAAIDFKYTSKKPNSASGFDFAMVVDDEAAPPPMMKGITLTFASGSKLNIKGAPICATPQPERAEQGHAASCPAESQIGEGVTHAYAGGGKVEAGLTFWNVDGLKDALNVEPLVNGNRLPYFGGLVGARSLDFVYEGSQQIADIAVTVEKHSVGRVNYLTTPKKCPRSKKWALSATINYEDGTKQKLKGTSPCKKK